MSTASSSQQNDTRNTQNTIDLTLDDDSPPPRSTHAGHTMQNAGLVHNVLPSISNVQLLPRAPPFTQQHTRNEHQQVIDLSSDDEDERQPRIDTSGGPGSPSPEVQFIHERTLPQPRRTNSQPPRRPRLPTPPGMRGNFGGNFGGITAFLRDNLPNVFGNLRRDNELPEEALNRIDGLLDTANAGRAGLPEEPGMALDEYDAVQLDYARPAWNLGGDLLIIEDANPHPVPPPAAPPAYKEPAPARDGFTRNYEEDDMLICGYCGDELATGKTDQKQQVWVIKQCGHVSCIIRLLNSTDILQAYCGDCAHNRIVTKARNNRDTKRVANKKTNGFKVCTVPDCKKAVDSKTKMFQIYL